MNEIEKVENTNEEDKFDVSTSLMLTGKGKDLYSKLKQFVQKSLIENEHYGKVPGTSKPSLFKGGAELLAKEADLVPTFEILYEKIDFDQPLFAYMIKCTLHRGNEKVSEAMGGCSNKERKFLGDKVDKFFLFNNVPKMAEKRAYVSAVVRAWGLSGIFTQDMEDLEMSNEEDTSPKISTIQKKAFAIVAKMLMTDEEMKEDVQTLFGHDSRKDMTEKEWGEYVNVLNDAEKFPITAEQLETIKTIITESYAKNYPAGIDDPKLLSAINKKLADNVKGHKSIDEIKNLKSWEAKFIIRQMIKV